MPPAQDQPRDGSRGLRWLRRFEDRLDLEVDQRLTRRIERREPPLASEGEQIGRSLRALAERHPRDLALLQAERTEAEPAPESSASTRLVLQPALERGGEPFAPHVVERPFELDREHRLEPGEPAAAQLAIDEQQEAIGRAEPRASYNPRRIGSD